MPRVLGDFQPALSDLLELTEILESSQESSKQEQAKTAHEKDQQEDNAEMWEIASKSSSDQDQVELHKNIVIQAEVHVDAGQEPLLNKTTLSDTSMELELDGICREESSRIQSPVMSLRRRPKINLKQKDWDKIAPKENPVVILQDILIKPAAEIPKTRSPTKRPFVERAETLAAKKMAKRTFFDQIVAAREAIRKINEQPNSFQKGDEESEESTKEIEEPAKTITIRKRQLYEPLKQELKTTKRRKEPNQTRKASKRKIFVLDDSSSSSDAFSTKHKNKCCEQYNDLVKCSLLFVKTILLSARRHNMKVDAETKMLIDHIIELGREFKVGGY